MNFIWFNFPEVNSKFVFPYKFEMQVLQLQNVSPISLIEHANRGIKDSILDSTSVPQPPPPPLTINLKKIQTQYQRRFNKSKAKKLIDGLHNYRGKNLPINYKSQFNFSQQWQQQVHQHLLQDFLLQDINLINSIFCFVAVVVNCYCIWALSVQRYFRMPEVTQSVHLYEVTIGLKSMQIIAKGYMRFSNDEGDTINVKNFAKLIFKEVLCIFYMVYLYGRGTFTQNVFEILVEMVVYYLLWSESSKIYERFKVNGEAIKFQNQLKIIDLLINVFAEAHIFAIIMYSASQVAANNNWTVAIGLQGAPQMTKYIYSFYFACTTMLTIGYGDITPKNQHEVMVIIFIQIIGVLSFGYFLSELGHTLSKMRQKQEELQIDLQTVSKMANFYNLQKKLEQKAKSFLLTNQNSNNSLKPSDENSLLLKLNEQLRSEITHQNSLSIIKSSIFFLCHWTKIFQLQIAKCLQKKLISPNEKLGEGVRNDRIFIIKQGKVKVFMNRFGSNSNQKKLLKIITINPFSEVTDNLYGYTTAFSNRPVYLQALAKDFTSTYSITKDDFLKCIELDVRDFQYYHQIKCRVDQAQFCEQWETPAIKNIREHYMPSKIFLIKRYKKQLEMNINARMEKCVRRDKCKHHLLNKLKRTNFMKKQAFMSLSEKTLEFQMETQQMKSLSSDEQEINSNEASSIQINKHQEVDQIVTRVAYEHARNLIKFTKSTKALDQNENKRLIAKGFEVYKDYTNFFPKNNFTRILLKFEKQNCLQTKFDRLKH